MRRKIEMAEMIAIVEDDESVGRSLERFLRASGYDSAIYRSAESFLADTRHREFDCLIADLQLSGMSGFELQERLVSAGVIIPMILMTARDGSEIDEVALQAHGAVLLRKSDPGEVLVGAICRVTNAPIAR